DAIRKVEADAARKARADQRAPAAPVPRRDHPAADGGRVETRRPEPPAANGPSEPAAPHGAAQPSARERLLNARAATPSSKRDGIKGFRDVVGEVHDLGGASAKAAQSARDMRDSYPPPPAYRAPGEDDAPHALNDYASEGDADDLSAEPHGGWHGRNRQPSFGHADEDASDHDRQPEEDDHVAPPPARNYRGLLRILWAVLLACGVLATLRWRWPRIAGVFHSIGQIGARQPAAPSREAASQPKFSGRVPQEGTGQAPAGQAPNQA